MKNLDEQQQEVLSAFLKFMSPNARISFSEDLEKAMRTTNEDTSNMPFLPPPAEEESTSAAATAGNFAAINTSAGMNSEFSTATALPTISSSSAGAAADSNSGYMASSSGVVWGGVSIDPHLSEATPRQLMAMSPCSQVFIGGPVPGVSVLHTVGYLGGKSIFKSQPADDLNLNFSEEVENNINTSEMDLDLADYSINTASSIRNTTTSSIDTKKNNYLSTATDGISSNEVTYANKSSANGSSDFPGQPISIKMTNAGTDLRFGTAATLSQAAEVLSGDAPLVSQDRLRFYLGSSKWAVDQLRDEIHMGSWTMVKLRNPEALDGSELMKLFAPDVSVAPAAEEGSGGSSQAMNPVEAQAAMWQKMLGMVSTAHAELGAIPATAWEELQDVKI